MARRNKGRLVAAQTLTSSRVPKVTKKTTAKNETAAGIGYEAQLWQMADAAKLDAAIARNLKELGYGG